MSQTYKCACGQCLVLTARFCPRCNAPNPNLPATPGDKL